MSIFSQYIPQETVTVNEQQVPVNEVYFGRTKGIERCYNAFCKFRDKYCDDGKLKSISQKSPNNIYDFRKDKEYMQLTKEFEREFGFEEFNLIFIKSEWYNMCTIPLIRGDGQNLITTSQGYKFTPDAHAVCCVFCYKNLFFDDRYTHGAMFTIVMHEIGHNFQQAIFSDVYTIDYSKKTSKLVAKIAKISQNVQTKGTVTPVIDYNALDKEIDKLPKDEIDAFTKYMNIVAKAVSNNKDAEYDKKKPSIIAIIGQIFYNYIDKPLGYLIAVLGMSIVHTIGLFTNYKYAYNYNRNGEKFADSFPGMYGFGAEAVAAQEILNNYGNHSDDINEEIAIHIPIIGHVRNMIMMPLIGLIHLFDCHPNGNERKFSYKSQLYMDLNNENIGEKTKKMIKKDLEDIEKTEEELDKIYKAGPLNPDCVFYIFNKISGNYHDTKFGRKSFEYLYHGILKKVNKKYDYDINQEE